jgi:glyoxylase-like metal-dependent hydrolase (beta-lactamase superfamily II)
MQPTGREQALNFSMNIICIPRGPFMSNMYLAYVADEVFVIDPSVSPDSVNEDISVISAILITHGHYDHIKYVEEWHQKYPKAPVYMNPEDSLLISDPRANCSFMDGIVRIFDFPYEKPADTITFGSVSIRVIPTPGHTMGSVCYLFSEEGTDYLFTGDTVFEGSVGRTDMPGGSYELLKRSVAVLSTFPAETKIYPGHGPDSTIGNEIRFNPFFER